MKILHTGDWHININSTRLGKPNTASMVRKNRLEILQHVIKIAIEEEDVDIVCLPGDLFDKSQPYPQDYEDLINILRPVEDRVTFIIPGNHDEITLKGCGLQVIGQSHALGLTPQWVDTQEYSFILCPWGTPLDFIKKSIGKCPLEAIVLLHGGVQSESHSWVEVDGEQGNYSLKELEECGATAIMLSHFHGQKMLAPHIWYAGSPDNVHGFSEENDEKGFLIWYVNKDNITVKQYSTKQFIDNWKTVTPQEFFNLSNFNGYLRIKGEVNDKERLDIIKILKDFECIDYKLDLTSVQKKIKVDTLTGKNDQDILTNYFKKKGIKNYKELLKLDKEIL